jgi:hypothetical protein
MRQEHIGESREVITPDLDISDHRAISIDL